MQIRAGYEIVYNCPQSTPMILMVHIHYSRAVRYRRSRSPDHQPIRADHVSSRCVWQLVQPDRGAGRPDSIERQRRSARFGRTGRRRSRMPGSMRSRDLPGRDSGLPAGQPLLRDRSSVGRGLEPILADAARMAARPGDLRLRP